MLGLWSAPANAQQLRFAQSRALGRKVSDKFTVARLAGEGTKIE
jgi:hypothetical protein